jgi:sedoheptulose-bisphosphatase
MSSIQRAPFLGEAPSCTSFYTNVEEQDSYPAANAILQNHCSDERVRQVLVDLLLACEEITVLLRSQLVYVSGATNEFGDTQLSVDVSADQILWTAAEASSVIYEASSEEDPVLRNVRSEETNDDTASGFTVCWDPLDGSSIVDNNWAVGTMVGVWPFKTNSDQIRAKNSEFTESSSLFDCTGRDQATSLVALYGPRTTVLVALDDGTYEFTYGCSTNDKSDVSSFTLPKEDLRLPKWICTRQKIRIRPDNCRIFSPANLRAAQELPNYQSLIQYYMTERYTLRYTGGLVPDVYQQFTKHQGIYTNPTSDRSPAKLRITYEAAPLGLLVEKAGGKTSDGCTGLSILDVPIKSMDQRTALCLGSATEVDRYHAMMGISID